MKAPVAPVSQSADLQKAQDEVNLKFAEALAVINKKLDVAMTVSTEGIKKLVLEDNVSTNAASSVKKNLWIHDYFGVKDDLGGQQ
jgi:hypothetical protein